MTTLAKLILNGKPARRRRTDELSQKQKRQATEEYDITVRPEPPPKTKKQEEPAP